MRKLKLPKANLIYCRHELESIPVDRGYAVISVSKWNYFCDAFRKMRKKLDVSDDLLEALINLVKNQEQGWRASNMPESHIQVMPYLKEARAAINKATGENNE
jgi:hypothetical protein